MTSVANIESSATEGRPRWSLASRITTHTIAALGSGILVFLGMVAGGTQSLNTIQNYLHPSPTALQLANQTAEGQFSRQLTTEAWDRLFWIRAYINRVRHGASDAEIEQAWAKYVDADLQWNRDYVTNLQALRQFYPGQNKDKTYSEQIQPQFVVIGSQMDDIRYPTDKKLGYNHGPIAPTLGKNVNALNALLFDFMTKQ